MLLRNFQIQNQVQFCKGMIAGIVLATSDVTEREIAIVKVQTQERMSELEESAKSIAPVNQHRWTYP